MSGGLFRHGRMSVGRVSRGMLSAVPFGRRARSAGPMKSVGAFSAEMATIRRRTFQTLGFSILFHGALLALLSLVQEFAPGPLALTEITLLEPGEGGGAAGASPAAASPIAVPPPSPRKGIAVKPSPETVQFAREERDASFEPEAQDPAATGDRLAERLASLQRQAATRRESPAAALVVPLGLPGSSGAGLASLGSGNGIGMGTGTGTGSGVGLNRGGGGGGTGNGFGRGIAPLVMKRSAERPATPVAAVVPKTEPPPAMAPSKREGVVAERTLAGAVLTGPVANRKLISHPTPKYPEWAKKEGVEATVRLMFTVLPNGVVKENIVVQKTSGYQDFDVNATEALRGWRFEALRDNAVGEQWGEITFRYRLSDPGRE